MKASVKVSITAAPNLLLRPASARKIDGFWVSTILRTHPWGFSTHAPHRRALALHGCVRKFAGTGKGQGKGGAGWGEEGNSSGNSSGDACEEAS